MSTVKPNYTRPLDFKHGRVEGQSIRPVLPRAESRVPSQKRSGNKRRDTGSASDLPRARAARFGPAARVGQYRGSRRQRDSERRNFYPQGESRDFFDIGQCAVKIEAGGAEEHPGRCLHYGHREQHERDAPGAGAMQLERDGESAVVLGMRVGGWGGLYYNSSKSSHAATILKPQLARGSFVLVIVLLLVLDRCDYEHDY